MAYGSARIGFWPPVCLLGENAAASDMTRWPICPRTCQAGTPTLPATWPIVYKPAGSLTPTTAQIPSAGKVKLPSVRAISKISMARTAARRPGAEQICLISSSNPASTRRRR